MEENGTLSRPSRGNPTLLFGAILVWLVTGAVAVTALVGSYGKGGKTPPPPGPPPTEMMWASSFEDAMQRSLNEHRPVMVDFYTQWCGACKYLDANVYTRPEILAESAGWIVVKVDAEQRRDVAQQYGVTSYPTIAFLRGNGQPLDYMIGAPPAEMLIGKMRNASSTYYSEPT